MRQQRGEQAAAEFQAAQLAGDSGGAGPETDALWRELRPKVDGAIAAVPDKYRTPLTLVYLAGRPQREVAAALRLNEGTLRWRLSHALGRMCERLGASRLLRRRPAAATGIPWLPTASRPRFFAPPEICALERSPRVAGAGLGRARIGATFLEWRNQRDVLETMLNRSSA